MSQQNPPAVSSGEAFVATPERNRKTLTRVTSAELLGQSREVIIEHGGDEYRLRLTSQGKLILTK
jgi:hemin uptake protein HemP